MKVRVVKGAAAAWVGGHVGFVFGFWVQFLVAFRAEGSWKNRSRNSYSNGLANKTLQLKSGRHQLGRYR